MTTSELPAISDTLSAIGSIQRAWVLRSMAGSSTPRSADELAEVINVPVATMDEHLSVLRSVGLLLPADQPAGSRPRFTVDAARLEQLVAQLGSYLLNR